MSSSFDNYGRPQSATSTQSNKSSNVTEVQVFPTEAIPIIFLPGILGSPLRSTSNEPAGGRYKSKWAWFPDFSVKWVAGLFTWKKGYADLTPAERKRLLDPNTTEALGRYDQDIESDLIDRIKPMLRGSFSYNRFQQPSVNFLSIQEALRRGWATVMWGTYGTMLSTLEKNLRYITYTADPYSEEIKQLGDKARLTRVIHNAIQEVLDGKEAHFREALEKNFPEVNPEGATVQSYIESIKPLLSKGRDYHYPVFAVGYNWLKSNNESAQYVHDQIQEIIQYVEREPTGKADPKGNQPPAPNSGGLGWSCDDGVIVITHSMGGLVGRALAKNHPNLNIRGIVHSAQPCDGSATLYARMKGGWEGIAGLFLAEVGDELMPVLTQSPGAMELSPNQNYAANWLRIYDGGSKRILASYPKPQANGKCDPYREIYLEKDAWWKLGEPALMNPNASTEIEFSSTWKEYAEVIAIAKKFHADLGEYYHSNTYMFYGNSPKYKTWGTVTWDIGYYDEKNMVDEYGRIYPYYVRSSTYVPFELGQRGKATSYPVRRGSLGQAQMNIKNDTVWQGQLKAFMHKPETDGDGTVPFNSANPWQAKGRVWEADAQNTPPMTPDVPDGIQYTFQFKNKPFEHASSYEPANALNVTFYALLNIIGKEPQ